MEAINGVGEFIEQTLHSEKYNGQNQPLQFSLLTDQILYYAQGAKHKRDMQGETR